MWNKQCEVESMWCNYCNMGMNFRERGYKDDDVVEKWMCETCGRVRTLIYPKDKEKW